MSWFKFRYNLGRSTEPEPLPTKPWTQEERAANEKKFYKMFGVDMSEKLRELTWVGKTQNVVRKKLE